MRETLHPTIDTKPLQLIISKEYSWLRHLTVYVVSIFVLYYSEAEYVEPYETYSRAVIFFQILFLAYTNMYYFVPQFLFRKKYVAYGLSIVFSMAFWSLTHRIANDFFRPHLLPYVEDNVGLLSFSFIILVLTVASAAIKLFQRWVHDAQRIYDLEQAKTQAELEQLKNQINPHFLFNMLNNANVLTKKDPDKASQVLMKLSDLLRYQLYDSAREKVLLTADIRFLEDFLNLEKIRRDSFDFVISKEGDLSGVQIPALLFISFVENAVKHNNDSAKASYVNLFFNVWNDELFFRCINSKPAVNAVRNESGGLGLVNIKRRLELLFPSTHTLTIEDNAETYCVTLIIKL
ncbi:sensor histidine kinase [Flavobacterium caeni]|uniref:Histidine kinase n=1 Tax=Flavobacterium caeni TaxID=490189 RepID=A0A1G5B0Z5_9FLAO|nr:histidine kinase [Flavobacterium caeni]SCX83819.1 Histidine kinase [Flavobacterium caeni]